MVYPFTQAAEPALAEGFIATNYCHHHHGTSVTVIRGRTARSVGSEEAN